MLKIDPQLIRRDGSGPVLVQVREGLLEGLPLRPDLIEDSPREVHLLDLFLEHPPVESLVPVENDLRCPLILGVLVGVVPKVEALALLYDTAQPFAKVRIVDPASPLVVLVNDELCQVVEVKGPAFLPQDTQYVLDCHVSIVVCV